MGPTRQQTRTTATRPLATEALPRLSLSQRVRVLAPQRRRTVCAVQLLRERRVHAVQGAVSQCAMDAASISPHRVSQQEPINGRRLSTAGCTVLARGSV